MGVTKTVWWDKNNNQHDGWIKDGKTYVDEAATTRIPVGSTSQTAGGTYKMTANGGIPTYATAKNQYEAKSQAAINAYEAAGNIQQERISRATNAAVAALHRQKRIAEENRRDADEAARDAYIKAANPFGAMEEQRVKLGLDESGYSESSKLKLASAYGEQLNENLRAMNEQLRNLDVQIAQAKASGKYELANIYESRAQNILQQQIALQGNIYSGDMQAMGQAESVRQFDEQMAAQKEQAEKNNKWNLALMFIENGKDASFISETLGIPQADVNTLIAAVNADKNKASYGGGGKPKVEDVLSTMLSFENENEARAYLLSLNKYDADERAEMMELYEAMKEQEQSQAYQQSLVAHNSRYGTAYDSVWSNVRRMLDKGKTQQEIINYITLFADNGLTDEGVKQIEKNLGWDKNDG